MKSQFEQYIKQSLDGFEADYNPGDWSDMQNRLSKAKVGKSSSIGKGLLIAASLLAASGAVYYFNTTENTGTVTVASNNSDKKIEVVAVKNENAVPVLKEEAKNSTQQIAPVSVKKETAGTDQKNSVNVPAAKKPETQTAVNTPENKPQPQEPVPSPVVAQPAFPSAALSAAFRSDLSKVCEGASVQFTADKNDASCTYKWYFGDKESSAEQNPKHTFAEAGTYIVKLHVTNSKDKTQAEQKNTIIVAVKPSVRMDVNPSDESALIVNFEADADKAVDWKWNFDDKETSSVQNPAHTFKKYGVYKVSVTVKNSAGCAAVAQEEVNLQLNLGAANGVRPFADVNNTWMPAALRNGEYPVFTLTIMDKSGKTVFKTSDKNSAWDGKGTQVGDTFKWVAIVKDKNGNEIPCQGLITIAD